MKQEKVRKRLFQQTHVQPKVVFGIDFADPKLLKKFIDFHLKINGMEVRSQMFGLGEL